MKTVEAIRQLEQVSRICTTTPLAEAALMGARALEKKEKPSWIPVDEDLPRNGKEVLVTAVTDDGERFHLLDTYLNGYWLNCDGTEWTVLAWMDLPDIYSEGDADETD